MPIIVWSMLAVFYPWRRAGFMLDSALPTMKARPRTQSLHPVGRRTRAAGHHNVRSSRKKHTASTGQRTGRITVISNDGCVIKQQSATVLIEQY